MIKFMVLGDWHLNVDFFSEFAHIPPQVANLNLTIVLAALEMKNCFAGFDLVVLEMKKFLAHVHHFLVHSVRSFLQCIGTLFHFICTPFHLCVRGSDLCCRFSESFTVRGQPFE